MDQSDLRRLAEAGLVAFPLERLTTAVEWLHDYGEATGDARYSSLARTLSAIEDWHDVQSGQMLTETLKALDAALKETVPEILDTASAADAAPLARGLRMKVQEILAADARCIEQKFREQHPDNYA
jgi:hypothetical protein